MRNSCRPLPYLDTLYSRLYTCSLRSNGCSMVIRINSVVWVSLFLLAIPLFGQGQSAPKAKPRVIVVGVNGMELDIIRPLILKGQMPNLASVIEKGAYGKLRTVSAPNRSEERR